MSKEIQDHQDHVEIQEPLDEVAEKVDEDLEENQEKMGHQDVQDEKGHEDDVESLDHQLKVLSEKLLKKEKTHTMLKV